MTKDEFDLLITLQEKAAAIVARNYKVIPKFVKVTRGETSFIIDAAFDEVPSINIPFAVLKGLEDAKAGKVCSLGSFAQYADLDIDD